MNHTVIAVDLASSVFQIAVSTRPGRVKRQIRLRRPHVIPFFADQRPAIVVMEACGSAHHWARRVREFGHKPVLLPPNRVRPYVVRTKTDRNDAKALLEAYRNKEIHPVPVKTEAQHTLTSLHRARAGWVATRTARINAVRGLLRELGILLPAGALNVVPNVRVLVADADNKLSDSLRDLLAGMCDEIQSLEEHTKNADRYLKALTKDIPAVQRLLTIPGIGPVGATALYAFIGDPWRFRTGRHLSSYLGLTPSESSSGLKRRLGRITKHGDNYLRYLLIHAARALLRSAKLKGHPTRLHTWSVQIDRRLGHNKAVAAIANKLARIVWSVWKKEVDFQSLTQAAA